MHRLAKNLDTFSEMLPARLDEAWFENVVLEDYKPFNVPSMD